MKTIYRMTGITAVAVSVAAMIEFIVYLIHTHPLAITAIVLIFVAGGFYRIYKEIADVRGNRSG